jgi:hypothetical protein
MAAKAVAVNRQQALERGLACVDEAHALYEKYFRSLRSAGVNPAMGDGVWLVEKDAQELRTLLRNAKAQLQRAGVRA